MNPKLKMFLKILLIIFLLLCVVGAGIVAAMFFGLFGDEFEITKEELTAGSSNTIVVDSQGNEIASLNVKEQRKTISLSEMPQYLPKAYIAIEDKRFYSHSGVDIKRTAGAIGAQFTIADGQRLLEEVGRTVILQHHRSLLHLCLTKCQTPCENRCQKKIFSHHRRF